MSVYAMAKNAEETGEGKSYLVALKDYIPAEALAIYIFAVGFLAPAKDAKGADVAIITGFSLAVGLVASAVIAVGALTGDVSGNGLLNGRVSEKTRRRVAVILVAWSALIAYVLATLQPFGVAIATVDIARFLAVLAALWAVVLPFVASALGVRGGTTTT